MWKNWFIYLFAVGCSAIFTVLYLKQSAFIVLLMVAAVPLVYSVITCILARRHCRIHFAEEPVAWEKNTKTKIEVVVENDSDVNVGNAAWISLSVNDGMGTKRIRKKKKIYLMAGSQKVPFELIPRHSGIHEIVIEKLTVCSGFSLLRSTIRSGETRSFLIMPQYKEFPIDLETLHEENEGDSERFSAVRPGNDPSELYDIRDYRPGDKINRVNWKFTAKNGQLMVQDYGFPIACDTAVFLDISGGSSSDRVEEAVEVLYYVILNYVLENKLFYVIWRDFREEGIQRRMISGDGDVYDLFHDLFRSGLGKTGENLEEIYSAQCESEFLSGGIFIYTGRKELDEELTRLKLRADRMEFVHI